MLHVEGDSAKAFARDHFGQQRRCEPAPSGKNSFAGAQPRGERKGCRHVIGPALTARFDLPDRLRRKLVDDATNLVIGEIYSLGIEVGAQLVEHVVVAARFKGGCHECLGVGLRVRARERKLPGRPQADKLVAASRRLELELLVVDELSLETFLALVETGHSVPRASRRAGLPAACRRCHLRPCITGCGGQGNIMAERFAHDAGSGRALAYRLCSPPRSASLRRWTRRHDCRPWCAPPAADNSKPT